MRAAIYARVSTDDGRQTVDNQIGELRTYAAHKQWHVVSEYTDQASGAKGKEKRPGFAQLFKDANRGKFDVVLVWSLDRFTREGIGPAVTSIAELKKQGVEFHSYTEPLLQTSGPHAELICALLAYFAQFERERIADRIRAGVRRAQEQGKHCGRTRDESSRTKVLQLRAEGKSLTQISTLAGVAQSTVCRILRENKAA